MRFSDCSILVGFWSLGGYLVNSMVLACFGVLGFLVVSQFVLVIRVSNFNIRVFCLGL